MRRWAGLGIIGLVGFLGFLNQQLLGLLLEPAKQDLGLTDTQIGFLNGFGVAVFYAFAAIPIGWLADRYDRRAVLAGCLLIWSLATAGCGLAYSYSAYATAAILMAMGESALIPIIYAMVPPIFPPRERATANAIVYGILVSAGGLGLAIGGFALGWIDRLVATGALSTDLAPWRILFVAAGALGLPLMLALAVVPYAPRTAVLDAAAERPDSSAFVIFLRTHALTISLLFMGMALYGIAWTSLYLWTPAILGRSFGYSAERAGTEAGLALTVASLIAVVIAWWLMRTQMPKFGPGGALRLVRWGCYAAFPAVLALPFASTAAIFLWLVSIAICGIVVATALAPMILQDLAPNIFSTRVMTLFPLVSMIPRAIAPSAIGVISDYGGATPNSLLFAVCVVCSVVLPAGILLLHWVQPAYGRMVESNRA